MWELSCGGCGKAEREWHPAAMAYVTGSVRVIVVDDDPLVRAAIAMILGPAPGADMVGEAADGSEVLTAVDRYAPDVVLMDIRMPQVDGLAATELLRAPPPPARDHRVDHVRCR